MTAPRSATFAQIPAWTPRERVDLHPLLIQLMFGPMAGHMLLRPVLQDAPGQHTPPVDEVARTFAEAFVRATAQQSVSRGHPAEEAGQ